MRCSADELQTLDRGFLARALDLADRGRATTSPNPRVGAVVVAEGRVVGEGFHALAGGPHAEVIALAAAGELARGATVYVNLEPCAHHGRTPPCTEALVAAGVARVVACHRDPNTRVAGRGFERLAAAGVEVVYGDLAAEAVRRNLPFLSTHVFGRPTATLKWAMSLDGKIATVTGESQWISSPEGRRAGLLLREEHDAILVGIGTVLADDPRLDRRLGLAHGPNLRVVLDRRLRTPASARLFSVAGPVVVYTENSVPGRREMLLERGAEVVVMPPGQVEPTAVLADLGQRGATSVLVEGGGSVHAAFVAAAAFDRVVVDCAPLLLGGREAPSPVGGAGTQSLAAASRLEALSAVACGADVILEGLRQGCSADLLRNVVD